MREARQARSGWIFEVIIARFPHIYIVFLVIKTCQNVGFIFTPRPPGTYGHMSLSLRTADSAFIQECFYLL